MLEFLRRSPHSRRPSDAPPVVEEAIWMERRQVLKALGLGGLAATLHPGCSFANGQGEAAGDLAPTTETTYPEWDRWVPAWSPAGGAEAYPAKRNEAYAGGRPITPEDVAAELNNFYEFLPGRAGPVHRYTEDFRGRPWELEIAGEVEEERTVDVDEIVRIAPLEERIYRFRCVEAWSMVVPWTGIPMAKLVEWAKPKPSARYLRFVSFDDASVAPGMRKADHYPWPYYEGLRMDEATHPLAMVVTGIFGHGLPAQHGAPIRVIVPWKYGYKSAKSVVRIEFTSEQPPTFWNDLQPTEYGFLSNVEPDVPHPRWSQATEKDIATGDRIPTRPYNGYASEVAALYAG